MNMITPDFLTAKAYIETPVNVMLDLDASRRQAEAECADPVGWFALAVRYDAQGRPSQAGSCRRRAEHYENLQSVAVETAAIQ